MKSKLRPLVACLLMAGVFNLTVATVSASEKITPAPLKVAANTPRIVSAKKPLSAQELAKYQQKAEQSQSAANHSAAGASSDTTVWIIVGVVVVVGVIALASGGGGGGGGGY